MPQGSATTARHQGALSAHNRFVPLGARYVPASSYRRPEAGRWKLAATDLEYEVTRVKSPVLGRDLNPMGRGDGTYYCNGGNLAPSGSIAIMGARPSLVGEIAYGFGSAVNNRELPSWEWLNRIMRAQMFCPLYIVTCPTYLGSMDDPCEGMDTSDPWVLCCLCMPAMCGECPPCSPTRGCCHVKLRGFGQYCLGRPPEPPPDGGGGDGNGNGGGGNGCKPPSIPPEGPPPGGEPPPIQPPPPPPGIPPGGPGGPGGGNGGPGGSGEPPLPPPFARFTECTQRCMDFIEDAPSCPPYYPKTGKPPAEEAARCFGGCVLWCATRLKALNKTKLDPIDTGVLSSWVEACCSLISAGAEHPPPEGIPPDWL